MGLADPLHLGPTRAGDAFLPETGRRCGLAARMASARSLAPAYPRDLPCILPSILSQVPGRCVHTAAGVSRTAASTLPSSKGPGAGSTVAGVEGKPQPIVDLTQSPSQHPEATGSTGETEAWPGGGAGLCCARRGGFPLPGLGSEHLGPVTSRLPTSLANSPGGGA